VQLHAVKCIHRGEVAVAKPNILSEQQLWEYCIRPILARKVPGIPHRWDHPRCKALLAAIIIYRGPPFMAVLCRTAEVQQRWGAALHVQKRTRIWPGLSVACVGAGELVEYSLPMHVGGYTRPMFVLERQLLKGVVTTPPHRQQLCRTSERHA
jgi:hypothetical protein